MEMQEVSDVKQAPLVDGLYLLKRFPGKGGWTFIEIPEVDPDKHSRFGWVKVRGTIDSYEIDHYPLQPMGNGKLFLPVKSAVRKKIKKQEGDTVRLILYRALSGISIPESLTACLKDVPGAYEKFIQLPDGKKKTYVDWIFSSSKEETQIGRIVKLLNKYFI
ncbi:YdeI/OmpD-associated family protein [uncultured Pedobacter sp.]|uniref:YdeI/OmpD-associated family protein n=1 Tax=uncultured Pedobacter sp. TaxID=246139 RepID=UPI00262DC833|nr:YdeI/OmpD-associated family protein [uncultured Pedobacter sp.]